MNPNLRRLRDSRLAIIFNFALLPALVIVAILLIGLVNTWGELRALPAQAREEWPRRGWFGPRRRDLDLGTPLSEYR